MITKPVKITKVSLQERLDKFQNFPSIPAVLEHIRDVSENPKASPADLAAVIMADHQLTSRILRMANSAFYRESSGKVTTVTQAIILLGTRAVTNLASSASLFDAMNQFSRRSSFDIVGFWTRSLATAVIARSLAMKMNRGRLAEEAFMSGFMHDIGQVILAGAFPLQYEKICELEPDSTKIHQTEMILLGIDHQDAGEYLTLKWRLPEGLSRVVGHHHEIDMMPRDKTDITVIALVHLADLMYPILLGDTNEARLDAVVRAARNYTSISHDMIQGTLDSCVGEIHDIADDFGISISDEFKKQSLRMQDSSQLLKLLELTESRLMNIETALEEVSSTSSIDALLHTVSDSLFKGLRRSGVVIAEFDTQRDSYEMVLATGIENDRESESMCRTIDAGAQALLDEGRTVTRQGESAKVSDDTLRSPLVVHTMRIYVPLTGIKRRYCVCVVIENDSKLVDSATIRWIEAVVQAASLGLERLERSGDSTQPTRQADATPVIS